MNTLVIVLLHFLYCYPILQFFTVVEAAVAWDSWNRPSPDLPRELRANAEKEKIISTPDPNYAAHVSGFLKAGTADRESPDLPSELRMLKYKNMASAKRIAAKELKSKNINPALAEEVSIR